jgi:catechol 2,3-dioxygenase-like lactoylglutathione lyase family enzyme
MTAREDFRLTEYGVGTYYDPDSSITMTAPFHRGLRHLALRVTNLSRSRQFYEQLLGMKVVWEPDADNAYFSSGSDNLALHQIPPDELASYQPPKSQLLDHVGVILPTPQGVDQMYRDLAPRIGSLGGMIVKHPKQHRDGSYSFYFSDPDGNVIQALYEPTISPLQWQRD